MASFEQAFADPTRGLIVDPTTSGPTLLIAFGGIASQIGGVPPFEFLSVVRTQDARRVFVRDLDQCWYQRGVRGASTNAEETTAALRAIIDDTSPSRVVTLGTSAGGFGAIAFGCAIGADLALAFGPQTFTSTWLRRWHRDRRWAEEILTLDALDPAGVVRDLLPIVKTSARSPRPTQVEIHYGAAARIDRVHAHRLRRAANVTVHAHAGGHNVSKELRDRGELDAILTRAVTPIGQ